MPQLRLPSNVGESVFPTTSAAILLKIVGVFVLFIVSLTSKAETVALSDDPDFIRASILINSPGNLPHQIFGHAAIRMECPVHGLDRVFSFNNNTADDYWKMLTEGTLGETQEAETADYIDDVRSEDRQVRSIPLNLTLNQKARLWEVLDSLKVLPKRDFGLNADNCFSVIADALDKAVYPERIGWQNSPFYNSTYGEVIAESGNGNYPWSYLLLCLSFGANVDSKSHVKNYAFAGISENGYNRLSIYSPDGTRRPLVAGPSQIVVNKTSGESPNRPTPVETAIIILVVVVAVTALQWFNIALVIGKILDLMLWIFITAAGLFIAYLTFGPVQYGGFWNWYLIPLNPLAWIPVVVWRGKSERLKTVWAVYAAILILYAAAVELVSPSTDMSVRIFAVALAIRCVWHIRRISRPLV